MAGNGVAGIAALIVGLSGLFAPAVAPAQEPRQSLPFSAYDRNGDGYIDAGEFAMVREEARLFGRSMRNAPTFAELDRDRDGRISKAEFIAGSTRGNRPCIVDCPAERPPVLPSFAEIDLNQDGRITEEEFNQARTGRLAQRGRAGYRLRGAANAPGFSDLDSNFDGAISPDEFSAYQWRHRRPAGRQ